MERPDTHRLRYRPFAGGKAVAGLCAAILALAGCSQVPDYANPVAWYHGAIDALDGEDVAQARPETAPVPGAGEPFPDLGATPKAPPFQSKLVDMRAVAKGLLADRKNARYTDQKLTPGGDTRLEPPAASLSQSAQVQPMQPILAHAVVPVQVALPVVAMSMAVPAPAAKPMLPILADAPPPADAPLMSLQAPVSPVIAFGEQMAVPAKPLGPVLGTVIDRTVDPALDPVLAPPPLPMVQPAPVTPTQQFVQAPAIPPAPVAAPPALSPAEAPIAAGGGSGADALDVKQVFNDLFAASGSGATAPAAPAVPVYPGLSPALLKAIPNASLAPVAASPFLPPLPPLPSSSGGILSVAPILVPPIGRSAAVAPILVPPPSLESPVLVLTPPSAFPAPMPTAELAPVLTPPAGVSPYVPATQYATTVPVLVPPPPPAPGTAAPTVRMTGLVPPPSNVLRRPAGGLPGSAAEIRFLPGSSELTPAAQRLLREVVRIHRERGGTVRVVGHASSRTRELPVEKHKMVNFEISLRRARAVAEALIGLGVDPNTISVQAMSDAEPVYYEWMPSGEAGNRRTEIFLDF